LPPSIGAEPPTQYVAIMNTNACVFISKSIAPLSHLLSSNQIKKTPS
jgi:hypothetical protein